ncbi:hypothetical protein [Bacillus sp. FJAT-49736]|uniref:hypothetical protein n=1 Tax=Bacillus sp. FJAT-49736 TaxID=2833582 RepID=UPI001BC933EE|nr:hypothetical protein [Bacillus sp. FJAT-49736]MBS4174804.1 hypothetical protein [Bacillus sp. FJAT-49736]MBS4175539.1 hypothetical protein [Bacillus sp. FJAT-49736]
MAKVDKRNKENFLGYVVLVIAVIFIISFVFFAHQQNKIIMENNINEALKQEKTELASYTYKQKRYDYQEKQGMFPLDNNHNSLYKTFYNMLNFNSELGNNRIYEVTGTNNEKYEVNMDKKFEVIEWYKN